MSLRDYSHDLNCFRWNYIIRRRFNTLNGQPNGTYDTEGRFIHHEDKYQIIEFAGSAPQPVSDRDLKLLPDGMMASSTVRLYADTDSILFDDHLIIHYPHNYTTFNGEVVSGERDYRVIHVSHRISHTRVIATQLHRNDNENNNHQTHRNHTHDNQFGQH